MTDGFENINFQHRSFFSIHVGAISLLGDTLQGLDHNRIDHRADHSGDCELDHIMGTRSRPGFPDLD